MYIIYFEGLKSYIWGLCDRLLLIGSAYLNMTTFGAIKHINDSILQVEPENNSDQCIDNRDGEINFIQ